MALTAKKVYAILKRQISDMEAKLNSPVRYRGTVATADLLPLNPDIGDMYNIESKSVYGEAGMNVAWNGVVWDTMGAPIDMSLYLTKEEAETVIQRLVTEYFEKNPVKPGATTEQAQQIEQNKTDIASLKTETGSLKEDISNKITKFYASSQGETHLADSDNGKIMDMMVYGKSEQKQYSGKNLLNPILQTTTQNGITCTANGDGTFTLNGTATANTAFILSGDILSLFVPNKKLKMIGTPKGGSSNSYRIQMWRQLDVPGELYDYGDGVEILAPTGNHNIAIWITNKFVCNNLIFKPMIVDASLYPDATYDDFEPYTGGQPSPSPDYPQEIKSVVNPTVKVCGKNFYPDGDLNISGKRYDTDFFPVILRSGIMHISFDVATDTDNGEYFIGVLHYDKNKNQIGSEGRAITIGQSLRHETFAFHGGNAGNNNEDIDLKDVSYVKMSFDIYNNTATKITYKNIMVSATDSSYESYKPVQTVTLPYTLNAIPVSSGGNVTINGQQYVSDYVDVERGKLVRMCKEIEKVTSDLLKNLSFSSSNESVKYAMCNGTLEIKESNNSANVCYALCSHFKPIGWYSGDSGTIGVNIVNGEMRFYFGKNPLIATLESAKQFFEDNEVYISGVLKVPKEIDLTDEEVQALKALATYYPTTNISVNSEQLDGYTVFNYTISMANGWNYVKQQIGDTRDYIYDMDARTQDTDLQAAEAYVNSEYAVSLTELEV